ncbi:hypothetical protein MC885_016808 [Smutsia gigantea]|nr:hypothetical protein MC885_016808 [Smutsia gigantea]
MGPLSAWGHSLSKVTGAVSQRPGCFTGVFRWPSGPGPRAPWRQGSAAVETGHLVIFAACSLINTPLRHLQPHGVSDGTCSLSVSSLPSQVLAEKARLCSQKRGMLPPGARPWAGSTPSAEGLALVCHQVHECTESHGPQPCPHTGAAISASTQLSQSELMPEQLGSEVWLGDKVGPAPPPSPASVELHMAALLLGLFCPVPSLGSHSRGGPSGFELMSAARFLDQTDSDSPV